LSDTNPYRSPRHASSVDNGTSEEELGSFLEAELLARRYVRFSIALFGVAVLVHFLLDFLIPGLLRGQWHGEVGLFFVAGLVMFFVAFSSVFVFLWLVGPMVVLPVSRLFHLAFGRNVPEESWHECTCHALWPLPYASALGGFVHLIYALGDFGGSPDDVIFVLIGNLLGAWCYLTIFWSWYKLSKHR